MKVLKVKRETNSKTAEKLRDTGYISRNTLVRDAYRRTYNIPLYSELRRMAEEGEISAYKVITEESGIESYWFKKKDIETLFLKDKEILKSEQQSLPFEFTVKVDEKHFEDVKNKYFQEIEEKAKELFDLTQKINNQKRDNITIYCPFTIGSVQTIWNDCIAEVQRVSKLNITVKYAEKKEYLDAGIPDDTHWQSKSQEFNYQVLNK